VLEHYRVQRAGPASGAPAESAMPC
jgi:hypothetical protein